MKGKRDGKRKERTDVVRRDDMNKEYRVHNGKERVKRKRVNTGSVGRRWGSRVKTRKPCTKGANRSLRLTKK